MKFDAIFIAAVANKSIGKPYAIVFGSSLQTLGFRSSVSYFLAPRHAVNKTTETLKLTLLAQTVSRQEQ
jgi:hypothetical protein